MSERLLWSRRLCKHRFLRTAAAQVSLCCNRSERLQGPHSCQSGGNQPAAPPHDGLKPILTELMRNGSAVAAL
jgi:hypothetical protein